MKRAAPPALLLRKIVQELGSGPLSRYSAHSYE
jgi:hypothetical protein